MPIINSGHSIKEVTIIPECQTSITSRSQCNPFDSNHKLPIFTAPMDSICDLYNYEYWNKRIYVTIPRNIDFKVRIKLINEGYWVALSLKEFEKLFSTNGIINYEYPKVIIDIANGHMSQLGELCDRAKRIYNKIKIIIGNIANPDTYRYLNEHHSDSIWGVRVGIGGGQCCITSSNTGVHYPMATLLDYMSTIKTVYDFDKDNCIKIIADGGIRDYSDVIKALALGADYVMIGTTFARMIESCAPYYIEKDKFSSGKINIYFNENIKYGNLIDGFESRISDYSVHDDHISVGLNEVYKSPSLSKMLANDLLGLKKLVKGMSTKEAQKLMGKSELHTSEGIKRQVNVQYNLDKWLDNLEDYLKSAMSYTNSRCLSDFIGNVQLIINSSTELEMTNK